MERHDVLQILREHEAELHAAGIVHLRVFGSVARDQSAPQSDVDLLADFDATHRLTLVKLGNLEHRIGEMLGVEVDLSTPAWLKEPVRSKAMQEAVFAF